MEASENVKNSESSWKRREVFQITNSKLVRSLILRHFEIYFSEYSSKTFHWVLFSLFRLCVFVCFVPYLKNHETELFPQQNTKNLWSFRLKPTMFAIQRSLPNIWEIIELFGLVCWEKHFFLKVFSEETKETNTRNRNNENQTLWNVFDEYFEK